MNKRILAIALLVYSVFGGGLLDTLDLSNIIPNNTPEVKIIDVSKPSDKIAERVQVFSGLITDQEDKEKIAIFNYEFANRVTGYETTSQQINDVYTLAGKTFFKDSLVNKYDGLAEEIIKLMEECMNADRDKEKDGTENFILTDKEKNLLSDYFSGVAWVLVEKG